MFWKKKGRIVGITQRLEAASEEERRRTAHDLWRLATELNYRRKFRDARDAINEAIKLFQSIIGSENDVAKCFGLLGEALYGLGEYHDSARAYLDAINVAIEANERLDRLQCRLWIDCGFALLDSGDRQLARLAWKNAAHLHSFFVREFNALLKKRHQIDDIQQLTYKKARIEKLENRINDLHQQIGDILVKPRTDEIFKLGCRCINENNLQWAVEVFGTLIDMDPNDVRGWIGRADARLALSCYLAEDYKAKGGIKYSLDGDELLSPINKPLNPPAKQRWWKLNERIMNLQHAAKIDYKKVLELDPENRRAADALRDFVA